MTCLFSLLAATAVIAASLLGGCSDNAINTAGSDARVPVATATADRASPPMPAKHAAAPVNSGAEVEERLASVALDDANLSDIRGGYDTSSGVTLNFAFQQATFVNHNLTESVVLPTLTISPAQGSVSSTAAMSGAAQPGVGAGSLVGLGITGAPSTIGAAGINSATVVANGTVADAGERVDSGTPGACQQRAGHRHPPRQRQWRGDQHDHQLDEQRGDPANDDRRYRGERVVEAVAAERFVPGDEPAFRAERGALRGNPRDAIYPEAGKPKRVATETVAGGDRDGRR